MRAQLLKELIAWAVVTLMAAGCSPLCASAISFSLSQGIDQLEMRALVQVPDSKGSIQFAISSSGLRGVAWMSRATQISDTRFELTSERQSPMSFRVQPDPLSLDRVYPSFVSGPFVSIVNLDYWILEHPLLRQAISASFPSFFIGSGCRAFAETSVDRGTGDQVQGRGRYAALATDDSVCQVVDGLTVIDTGATPEWIRALAISELSRFAKRFAQGFQMHLPAPTLYLHADLNPSQRARYRGEAAWEEIIFLRFFGDDWKEYDEVAADSISKLVAHEVLHLWLERRFYQASGSRNAWFHEGAAEYLSLTAQENLITANSPPALNEASERLTACLRALGNNGLGERAAARGSIPYDCGYSLQWLLDIHDSSLRDQSIWERWRGYLASRPNREISWDGFVAWGGSEDLTQELVSPLFESIDFDQRVRALRARLVGFDLRVDTPSLNHPRTIRRLVLFHLLGETCGEGHHQFTIHKHSLELETGEGCGVLSGNPHVSSLDGFDLLSPNADLHAHLSSVCRAQGEVSLAGPGSVHVASVPCKSNLPPLSKGVHISREADSG